MKKKVSDVRERRFPNLAYPVKFGMKNQYNQRAGTMTSWGKTTIKNMTTN